MKLSICFLFCFLLSYGVIAQLDVGEMIKILAENAKNIKDVVNFIKSLGVSTDEKEKLIEEVQKYGNQQRVGDFYDVVVRANSLKDLQQGWNVEFSSSTVKEKYMQKFSTTIVGLTGIYDAGKTFLINEFINGSLASGVSVETVGISMKAHENIVWMDSAGTKRAVSSEKLEDRLATDHFTTKMVLHMSDVVIYVVNGLHVTDIHHINSVHEKLVEISPTKKFLVVHNFLNYWTAEEVEKHIKDDVIEAFSSKKDTLKLNINNEQKQCDRYLSHKGQVLHVVIAKKGSPAGAVYNPCGMALLRRVIEGVMTQREVDIFSSITKVTEGLIPRYFFLPGQSHDIPLVIDTFGVSVTKEGATIDMLSWKQISSMLQKAKEKIGVVSRVFGAIFGGSGTENENKVIDNPFAIEVVATDNENVRKIKLAKDFDLQYMPFNGNTHPDVAYKPDHEVFLGDTQMIIKIDLPDISFYEVGCSNQVTLVIRGVRDMDPALASLTRVTTPFNRRYGTFSITIPLPEHVGCHELKTKGELKNGVFTINHSWSICEHGFCS